MAFENCVLKLENALGKELGAKEKKFLKKTIENTIKKMGAEALAEDINSAVLKKMEALAQDIEIAAAIEKRNNLKNKRAQLQSQNYLKNVWGDDPAEGLKAILEYSVLDRIGSKNGLYSHISAKQNYYNGGFTSRLSQTGFMDLAISGQIDDQIFRAVIEQNKEAPDPKVLSKLSKEAIEIAKVIKEYNELVRTAANDAGAWIGKDAHYVTKRSYDPIRLQKFAGPEFRVGVPEHQKAWMDFVLENIDFEKSFPNLAPEDFDEALKNVYQQLSNGYHVSFHESEANFASGFQSLGKKLSHSREIIFKTPEAEFEYFKKIAQSDNLIENVMMGHARIARDTAIMEKLGPNAQSNLDRVVNETLKRLTKDGKGTEAKNLQTEYNNQMRKVWPVLTGEINVPENATTAKWGHYTRALFAMKTLGGAILSAPADIPMYASVVRYNTERTAGAFFKGMFEAIEGTIGTIGQKLTPDQLKTASEAGVVASTMAFPISSVGMDLGQPGGLTSVMQRYFKLNLLTPWQDRLRFTAVSQTLHRHALHADVPFKELPVGMQAQFRQFNLPDAHWDVIRRSGLDMVDEGVNIVTPENVATVPVEELRKSLGNLSDSELKGTQKQIVNNYRALLSETAYVASSEPGLSERAIMLQGTQSGTFVGEAVRTLGLLKSFTVSVMKRHISRELWGYNVDNISLPKALSRLISDPTGSGFGGMANMILWGAIAGYGAMSLKAMVKGKEPRIPTDGQSFGKILAASLAQSGSLGIYGDFLFGETNRFNGGVLSTLAGPAGQALNDMGELYRAASAGEDFRAKAFNLGVSYTPGVNAAYNLFYTKWALDYLLVYRMQEMMNPGYLRRMESRLSREKNQKFFVPPSQVIPYGGK